MNHVLLVSQQAMPNFLPVLNRDLKPDSVTLVVSDGMRNRAEWLKNEIKKLQVEIKPDIEIGKSETDIAAVQEALMKWAGENEDLMSESVLNVTGGTKPMAIAAQEVFRGLDRPVFYVDISTDKVSWVSKEPQPSVLLDQTPSLEQILRLNGLKIEFDDFKSVVDNEKWRHFCDEIARKPNDWALAMGVLNDIAARAVDNHDDARNRSQKDHALEFSCNERQCATPKLEEMLKILHDDELVKWKSSRECFVSLEAARFCAGIWLEHYVFSVLKGLGFDKKHALMNVQIVDAKGNRNELDSIVIHKNTCYVIEDKTKNMKRKGAADDAVYKLAQLSRGLGLRTKGILVSARVVRPEDKARAKEYGVEVIDWLPDVERELKRIMGLS